MKDSTEARACVMWYYPILGERQLALFGSVITADSDAVMMGWGKRTRYKCDGCLQTAGKKEHIVHYVQDRFSLSYSASLNRDGRTSCLEGANGASSRMHQSEAYNCTALCQEKPHSRGKRF